MMSGESMNAICESLIVMTEKSKRYFGYDPLPEVPILPGHNSYRDDNCILFCSLAAIIFREKTYGIMYLSTFFFQIDRKNYSFY